MTRMIYHMCPAASWQEALAAGEYRGTEDDRRDGSLFPHLYGPLDPAEAAQVSPLPLGPDGEHSFPPLA